MGTMDLAAAMVAKTVTMEDQMAYIHRSRAALEAIGPQVPSTHYRASSSMLPPHPRPTGSHPAPLPPMNAGARAGAIAVGVNGQQVQQPASHPHPHPVHPPPANIHHQAYQDNQYYREPQVHLEHQFQSHQPIVNGTSTTTNSSVYSAVDFLPPTVTNKPTTSQDQLAYIRSRSGSHGGKDDVDQAPMAKRARVD